MKNVLILIILLSSFNSFATQEISTELGSSVKIPGEYKKSKHAAKLNKLNKIFCDQDLKQNFDHTWVLKKGTEEILFLIYDIDFNLYYGISLSEWDGNHDFGKIKPNHNIHNSYEKGFRTDLEPSTNPNEYVGFLDNQIFEEIILSNDANEYQINCDNYSATKSILKTLEL